MHPHHHRRRPRPRRRRRLHRRGRRHHHPSSVGSQRSEAPPTRRSAASQRLDWPSFSPVVVGTTNGALDGAASAGRYDAFISKRDALDGSTICRTHQFGTGLNDHANAVSATVIMSALDFAPPHLPYDVCCGYRLFVAGSTEGNLQLQVNHGQSTFS